jgi:hypothetical protein
MAKVKFKISNANGTIAQRSLFQRAVKRLLDHPLLFNGYNCICRTAIKPRNIMGSLIRGVENENFGNFYDCENIPSR